jgi:hypothetical protein
MPWLVRWEGTSPPAKRITAVLDGRLGAEVVRRIVEALYASHTYSEAEIVAFSPPDKNPYRAQLGNIGGIAWEGQIACGHNPHLVARLVDNLMTDASGAVTSHERPVPKPPVVP